MRRFGALLVILLSSTAAANFDQPLCDGLLWLRELIRDKHIDDAVMTDLRANTDFNLAEKPSVMTEKKIDEGDPRGHRYLIRKHGKLWGSTFGSEQFAVQGDPRSFVLTFGTQVSRFFGYELLGNDALIVPSVKRFRWALDQINSWGLKEKIALGFYESAGVEETDVFLTHFARTAELPMSEPSFETPPTVKQSSAHSHDHAFHTIAFFIPSEIIQLGQRQAKALVDFRDYVLKVAPKIAKRPDVQYFFKAYFKRVGLAADFGTGRFASVISYYRITKNPEALDQAYETCFELLASKGNSPKSLLELMLADRFYSELPLEIDEVFESPKFEDETIASAMKSLLLDFTATRSKDSGFSTGLTMDKATFDSKLKRRLTRIEAAVRLYLQKGGKP